MNRNMVDRQFHQCNDCKKWRPVPKDFKRADHPDWKCSENTVKGQSSCEDKELPQLIHTNRSISKTAKRKREDEDPEVVGINLFP